MAVPFMNAKSPDQWEQDRVIAKREIISWLAEAAEAKDLRIAIEQKTSKILQKIIGNQSLKQVILDDSGSLTVLRSLTRRDIGTSQMATFLETTTNNLESVEAGRKNADQIAGGAEEILLKELDQSISAWILDGETPSEEAFNRTLWIASDRILRRSTSTDLRYKH